MTKQIFILKEPTGTPDFSLMAKCETQDCKARIKTVRHKYCDNCIKDHIKEKRRREANKGGFIYKMF